MNFFYIFLNYTVEIIPEYVYEYIIRIIKHISSKGSILASLRDFFNFPPLLVFRKVCVIKYRERLHLVCKLFGHQQQ